MRLKPCLYHMVALKPQGIYIDCLRTSNNLKREKLYYADYCFYPVNRPTNMPKQPGQCLNEFQKNTCPLKGISSNYSKLYFASSHFTIEYACMMWSTSSETAIQLLLAQVPYHIGKDTSVVEVSQFHLSIKAHCAYERLSTVCSDSHILAGLYLTDVARKVNGITFMTSQS